MKMFIPLLCALSLTIAEPPVGDSYASARFSHGHDAAFQRSPSQLYGPPSSRNSLATEYGPPRSRTSTRPSSSYGPPKSRISEEYGAPNARGSSKVSQEYGVPTRNSPSQHYGVPSSRNSPSQKYGAPSSRSSASLEYSIPASRSKPSQEYGVPSARNSPSQEYGLPESRNAPSEDYGLPSSRHPSEEYGLPSDEPSEEYGLPNAKSHKSSSYHSRNIESSKASLYGAPRQISEEYGTPERTIPQKPSSQYLPQKNQAFGRNDVASKGFHSKKLSQGYDAPKYSSLSTSYGVPSPSSDYSQEFSDFGARDVSDSYEAPAKSPSKDYGVPKAANLKTDAVASSYASAKSSPSTTYGAPSTHDSMPSDQYGVPEQYNARSSQGYEYGRSSDEDYQEPANYEFVYKVNDYITGSDFGHKESRQENRAEGTYFVVLPDGNKQVVEYEADERGFKPRISVEPVETARSGGYDDNAADLNDSEGPY